MQLLSQKPLKSLLLWKTRFCFWAASRLIITLYSIAPRHHPKICHKIWWEKLQVWKSELLKLNGFPIKLWRLNVKDEAREENSSSACLDNKTKTSHCKAFTSPSRLWDSYHLYRQHWIKFGPIDIQHMTLQPINRIVIFCFWIEQTMTHYDLFFKA